jgi:excisionase family DNA binding protein
MTDDAATEVVAPIEPPRLIPLAEAARLLGLSKPTIYRMARQRRIRLVRPLGRAMVPRSEVDRIERGEPMQSPVGEPVGDQISRRPKKVQLFPQLNG